MLQDTAVAVSRPRVSFGRTVLLRPAPLVPLMLLYIAANLCDFGITYQLLQQGGFTETNPVADYFLETSGIRGMAIYKASLVTLVLSIAYTIGLQQAHTARRLLIVSTSMVGIVVVYSAWLFAAFVGFV